jgi:hypothetical protein
LEGLQFPPLLIYFLQIHLGSVGSHVPAFIIETSYFGSVGGDCLVRAVSINHCTSPQAQGIMQHPTEIKTLATMIKEVNIQDILPFHLPNQYSIMSVKGSLIPGFLAISLDRVVNP